MHGSGLRFSMFSEGLKDNLCDHMRILVTGS